MSNLTVSDTASNTDFNTASDTDSNTASPMSTRDAAFFESILDLNVVIDARQRRAVEWARFADRLWSLGHRITNGSPT